MFYVHIQAAHKFFGDTDLDMAVAQFEVWRDENGFGASDIGSRYPLLQGSGSEQRRIGFVSYNGRVELDVAKPSQASRIAAARRAKALTA